jgi:hypothetical protein
MANSRAQRRKEKFLLEIKHFEYLKRRGLTSLEIAESLIHNMFVAMEEGIRQKDPNITTQELSQRMREISERELLIRNKRKRSTHGRN